MEFEIGSVTSYNEDFHEAVLMLKRMLKVGDRIRIYGKVIDFTQRVTSLRLGAGTVLWAQPGDDVAIQVLRPVQVNDKVYRLAAHEAPDD